MLSENTKKMYKFQLNKHKQIINYDDPYQTIENIKALNLSASTKKQIISAIMHIHKKFNEEDKIKIYKQYINQLFKITNAEEEDNFKGSEEVPEWQEVLKKREELKGDKEKYMIASLYTLQPPRRVVDYQKMIYVEDIKDAVKKTNNYYVKDNIFIFNEYKTKYTYGQQRVKVNEELKKIINEYIKDKGLKSGDKLITILIKNMANWFYKVNNLRHSYINKLYNNNELIPTQTYKKNAYQMGHNITTHLKYRKFKRL